jgi:benzil reductase ((S)-benzoin forming)
MRRLATLATRHQVPTVTNAPNRVALVTGTSSGIGAAAARELLKRGWRVAGISRRSAQIESSDYTHLNCDLSDTSELTAGLEEKIAGFIAQPTVARLGLVNCAADPGLLGTTEQIDPARALRVFALNVVAATWLMGVALRHRKPDAPLRIVNVSSGVDTVPFPGLGVYGSTKAALRMAGMVLAAELDAREQGGERLDVSVFSYQPGTVDTPMQTAVRSSSAEKLPVVGMFKKLAAEGRLAPAAGPAAEIADYLDGDRHGRFTERRFKQ